MRTAQATGPERAPFDRPANEKQMGRYNGAVANEGHVVLGRKESIQSSLDQALVHAARHRVGLLMHAITPLRMLRPETVETPSGRELETVVLPITIVVVAE
ncbi:unnamed protein product [Mycena citricolor]|uniref:Uncharacterized protein n=1 Tax=Mycena citricolor TaxID=2018698 RepID=A0AAD2HZD7_9AGAR|nr:unnamed protein product [Mycena citricolor]CAK5285029.1 unnamed protein product [Mycena citricolor]